MNTKPLSEKQILDRLDQIIADLKAKKPGDGSETDKHFTEAISKARGLRSFIAMRNGLWKGKA